jgi:hypothetical protein
MSGSDPPDQPPKGEPTTWLDHLERAAYFTSRAVFHEDMARTMRQAAEVESRKAEELRAKESRLNISVDSDTVNAMNATEKSPDALRSASRSAYKENAFVQARSEKGETITDVKALLEAKFPGRRFHQNVIQTWYVPVDKDAHRDCPIEVREFLRDHYGKFTSGPHKGAWRVPLDSWPLVRGR